MTDGTDEIAESTEADELWPRLARLRPGVLGLVLTLIVLGFILTYR